MHQAMLFIQFLSFAQLAGKSALDIRPLDTAGLRPAEIPHPSRGMSQIRPASQCATKVVLVVAQLDH